MIKDTPLPDGPEKSVSRTKHREGTVWQRRFWEHCVRDERDFARHCDYIHYNPVKHGLARTPGEWVYSTFLRYVDKGVYPRNWCGEEDVSGLQDKIGME